MELVKPYSSTTRIKSNHNGSLARKPPTKLPAIQSKLERYTGQQVVVEETMNNPGR
jgi:hypothetical protein